MLALIGWFLPYSTVQVMGLNITVNNTDLCDFNHTSGNCNGIRNASTVYWNNETDIEIFLYAHAQTVSQTSDIELFINGTIVSSVSSKPVGASPEENNKSIVAIIPRGSYYEAHFTNFHHYEWREYQIHSGAGLNTIVNNYYNNTTGTAGTMNHANLTNLNWANANHSIDADIEMNGNDINNISTIRNNTNLYIRFLPLLNEIYSYINNGTVYSEFIQLHNFYEIGFSTGGYFDFSNDGFQTNRQIISVLPTGTKPINIISNTMNTNLNADLLDGQHADEKVNKSGDTMTSSLYVPDINGRNLSLSSNLSSVLQKNGSIHGNKIIKYLNSTGSDITSLQLDSLYNYIFNGNPNVYAGVNLISFQFISDTGFPYFLGRRARGTDYGNGTAQLSALKSGDIFMLFNGAGYDNGTGWTGTASSIKYTASQDWNTTQHGSQMELQTTRSGTLNVVTDLTLKDGNATITGLSGTGNAYVCVDANGKLYRGSPTC